MSLKELNVMQTRFGLSTFLSLVSMSCRQLKWQGAFKDFFSFKSIDNIDNEKCISKSTRRLSSILSTTLEFVYKQISSIVDDISHLHISSCIKPIALNTLTFNRDVQRKCGKLVFKLSCQLVSLSNYVTEFRTNDGTFYYADKIPPVMVSY